MNQTASITAFQSRVYDALQQIPRGRVITYRQLAKWIGCRSCQAVGQALKRNPDAPRVPCHRVIKTDGSLGGYCGETDGVQLDKKQRLLREEGVDIINHHVPTEFLWEPDHVITPH